MKTHHSRTSLRQSIRQKIESIRQSYMEEATWTNDFPFDEITSQKRVPVTQEFIAMTLGAETRGEVSRHPAREHFPDALYKAIERLVGDRAFKYSQGCIDDTDDLIQDCMIRIWTKIGNYDEDKAKFTTWVYHVCRSVLNRQYSNSRKYKNTFIEQKENITVPDREHHYGDMISLEFAAAVRELADRFPEKKPFIYEVFGDPNTEGYMPPRLMRIAESARNVGMKKSEAKSFYSRVVKPFMKNKFKHERIEDGEAEEKTDVFRNSMGRVCC